MYSFVSRTRCASLLYQLAFCSCLAVLPLQHRGCTRSLRAHFATSTANISLPRRDQLWPTCNNTWQTFKVSLPSAHLSAATNSRGVGKQSGGILGDTINGPDRFVYLTYCKWRRLYAVCSKLCCVSLCLWLFCIVTFLCIASCKIKKLCWRIIVFSAVIMYRYISRSVIFPLSSWILMVPHQKPPLLHAAY